MEKVEQLSSLRLPVALQSLSEEKIDLIESIVQKKEISTEQIKSLVSNKEGLELVNLVTAITEYCTVHKVRIQYSVQKSITLKVAHLKHPRYPKNKAATTERQIEKSFVVISEESLEQLAGDFFTLIRILRRADVYHRNKKIFSMYYGLTPEKVRYNFCQLNTMFQLSEYRTREIIELMWANNGLHQEKLNFETANHTLDIIAILEKSYNKKVDWKKLEIVSL